MSNVLKADGSAGNAFAVTSPTLWPDHIFVDFDVMIPAATLAALAGAGPPDYFTADVVKIGDGLFLTSTDGVTWKYWFDESPNPATGTFAADAWQTIRLELEYLGASSWRSTWKLNGSALDTYTFAAASSLVSSNDFRAGAYNAVGVAGEVYYIDNVKVGTTAGGTDLFTDDFESGTFAAWDSETGSVSIVGDPLGATGWEFQLWNIADDTLVCDLTNAATASLSVRLNRPLAQTWTLAGDNACINTVHADSDLNLCVGTRTMKAYQDGVLRANTPVENIEWSGDENGATVVVTGYDPLHRLLTRTVYDSGGSFVKPSFSTPISGGDLIQQMVVNSVTYDDAVFDAVTPAVFPLATTGTFDTSIPPAVDLSFDIPDGPSTIADVLTLLTETGAVDAVVSPTDTSLGATAGILGELSAVNKTGSDLTATVHFDYNTGTKNVAKCRVSHDMGTVGNRVIYELGPRRDAQHWQGNITATETTPVNLEEYLDAEMISRAKYGTRTRISIYDSNGDENSARPLFHSLWETEVTTTINPRKRLYITPIAPSPFRPWIDFREGDLVTTNVGANLVGPAIAGTQRIYGFDVTITAEGLEQLGETVTSADAE